MQLCKLLDDAHAFWTQREIDDAAVSLTCDPLNEPTLLAPGRKCNNPVMF